MRKRLKTYTIEDLINAKLIPSSSRELSSDEIHKSLTYSEFISRKDLKDIDKDVICDNCIAASKDSKGIFSIDKDGILWRITDNKKVISKNYIEMDGNKLQRAQKELSSPDLKSFKNKEEQKMDSKDLLKSLMNEHNAQQEMAPVANFSAPNKVELSAEEKKAKKERDAAALAENISANVSAVADAMGLQSFARQHGRLVGYVTNNGPKILVSTPNEPILENGKTKLTAAGAADAQVKAKLAKGEKIAKRFLECAPKLVVRQSAPSKYIGVIYTAPVGALVPIDQFRKAGTTVEYNESEKDLVTICQSNDEAFYSLFNYFGGVIQEDPRTHQGSEATARVVAIATYKDGETTTKSSIQVEGRRRNVTDYNYIPLKVNKTVTLQDVLNGDDKLKADMNKSLFANLFNVTKRGVKYELLNTESKKLVRKDGDVIVSDYLSGSAPMKVTSWSDSNIILDNPALPVKEYKPKKSGNGETGKYVFFDLTNPNEELAYLSPERNPEYATIRGALGNLTFDEIAKSVAKKKKARQGGSGNKKVLDAAQATSLLYNAAMQATTKMTVDGAVTKDGIQNIYNTISKYRNK